MYYIEQMFDGVMHFRTEPGGTWYIKPIDEQKPATITLPISEYEQLKADAERYRFIESQAAYGSVTHRDGAESGVISLYVDSVDIDFGTNDCISKAIREAIDQAMKDKT
jgi:hypothetical protein